MSDVEKWIEQWRADLAGSQMLGNSTVNELESHLQEEMEHLKTSGLSDEEAFLVARHRLGDTASLEAEFAKVNTHRLLTNRLWWMIAGVLAYLVAIHFADGVSQVSLAITQATHLSPYVRGLVATIVQVGAFCGVTALVLWLCIRYSQPGVRSHMTLSGPLRLVFLLGLFANTLSVFIARMFSIPYAVSTIGPQEYGRIAMIESIGHLAWMLVGPLLLGVLLLVIHPARRQKTETQ